jgi:uncharacterized membrane protein/protein-disulfide isomerase
MLRILSKENQVIPLPFPVYFWTVTGLALAGFLDSLYMTMSHYRVYVDIGYRSFCAISKSINCDTVSQSTYSIFLRVPIPVWGVIGYSFYLILLSLATGRHAEQSRRPWALILLLSLLYGCISIVLALILTSYIYSYCIMCILVYALNFLLIYYVWLIRKRFGNEGLVADVTQDIKFLWNNKKRASFLFLPFLAVAMLIFTMFPRYWEVEPPAISAQLSQGMTEDGHPWIGAENPRLVIREYTDYLCFQCRKMHFYLRQLISQNPDKIRLVHYHYPMDHEFNPVVVPDPFHEGAGKLSLLAIHAATKGKFWEMNDILFTIARESKTIDLRKLAKDVGLDFWPLAASIQDPKIQRKLQLDIWKGTKLKVVGTPSYLVRNVLYTGNIPPEILKQALK